MIERNKPVLVAMSGGVDSSVTAALLQRKGMKVVGAFMKNWAEPIGSENICSWSVDFKDMQKVCKQLRIKALLFDFSQDYKKTVFKYFLKEYQSVRTPNPDVVCNREIKFGLFLRQAKKLGFNFIATGHYAQINKSKNYLLLKGEDRHKDQSYFLYQLTQDQLKHTLLPLGEYQKRTVRKLARKFHLATHDRPDSQGICNIGEVDLQRFLAKYLKMIPGDIVLENRGVIGRHQGLASYTIGQRRGIGIGGGTPYFVIKKDLKKNQLVIGTGRSKSLYRQKLFFTEPHWILGRAPKMPLGAKVKIRYRQVDQCAKITKKSPQLFEVKFLKPQRAITAGQSCVIYQKDMVLGGGIIK